MLPSKDGWPVSRHNKVLGQELLRALALEQRTEWEQRTEPKLHMDQVSHMDLDSMQFDVHKGRLGRKHDEVACVLRTH